MIITKFSSLVSTLFAIIEQQICKESSIAVARKLNAQSEQFQEKPNNISESHRVGETIEGELCCVCQSILNEGENTQILPCTHEFHKTCIGRWFDVCRKTCPVCRFTMADEENARRKEELTEEMMTWFSSFHAAGF